MDLIGLNGIKVRPRPKGRGGHFYIDFWDLGSKMVSVLRLSNASPRVLLISSIRKCYVRKVLWDN